MKDTEIVELFFNRDEMAIKVLSSKYENLLRKLSFNILQNNDDVIECLNDTYLKVWNSIPPQKPEYLKAFILKIMRNLSIDKYRKKMRRSNEINRDVWELDLQISSQDEVENKISLRQLVEQINLFLASLDKTNRIIFVKRYFMFETTSDIAVDLMLSENDIRVRLLRIRKKLKRYLNDRGYNIEEN